MEIAEVRLEVMLSTLWEYNMSVIIKGGSNSNLANVTAASAVQVDGSAVTQPVSIAASVPITAASLPLPTGAAADGTDGTGITPPIGAVGIRGWLSGIYKALTGTLTAAISGAVAVTGTFWQATQPVSGAFFQAIQPVSAAALPLPTNAAQETGGNLATLVTNTATIATNTANETNGASKTQVSDPTSFTGANVSAKGVQGANALAVQNLKDSGRIFKVISNTFTAAASATETLASLILNSESPSGTLTTAAAATNFTVTAGKRFRIQALLLTLTNITTVETSISARAILRVANNAAITVTSPILAVVSASDTADVLSSTFSSQAAIPDGLELSGTENFGVTYFANANFAETSITISLIGYEY